MSTRNGQPKRGVRILREASGDAEMSSELRSQLSEIVVVIEGCASAQSEAASYYEALLDEAKIADVDSEMLLDFEQQYEALAQAMIDRIDALNVEIDRLAFEESGLESDVARLQVTIEGLRKTLGLGVPGIQETLQAKESELTGRKRDLGRTTEVKEERILTREALREGKKRVKRTKETSRDVREKKEQVKAFVLQLEQAGVPTSAYSGLIDESRATRATKRAMTDVDAFVGRLPASEQLAFRRLSDSIEPSEELQTARKTIEGMELDEDQLESIWAGFDVKEKEDRLVQLTDLQEGFVFQRKLVELIGRDVLKGELSVDQVAEQVAEHVSPKELTPQMAAYLPEVVLEKMIGRFEGEDIFAHELRGTHLEDHPLLWEKRYSYTETLRNNHDSSSRTKRAQLEAHAEDVVLSDRRFAPNSYASCSSRLTDYLRVAAIRRSSAETFRKSIPFYRESVSGYVAFKEVDRRVTGLDFEIGSSRESADLLRDCQVSIPLHRLDEIRDTQRRMQEELDAVNAEELHIEFTQALQVIKSRVSGIRRTINQYHVDQETTKLETVDAMIPVEFIRQIDKSKGGFLEIAVSRNQTLKEIIHYATAETGVQQAFRELQVALRKMADDLQPHVDSHFRPEAEKATEELFALHDYYRKLQNESDRAWGRGALKPRKRLFSREPYMKIAEVDLETGQPTGRTVEMTTDEGGALLKQVKSKMSDRYSALMQQHKEPTWQYMEDRRRDALALFNEEQERLQKWVQEANQDLEQRRLTNQRVLDPFVKRTSRYGRSNRHGFSDMYQPKDVMLFSEDVGGRMEDIRRLLQRS